MEDFKFQNKYNWIIVVAWLTTCFIYLECKNNDRTNRSKSTVEINRSK